MNEDQQNKYDKKKSVNIFLLIVIGIVLFASFINTTDIKEMFGLNIFVKYGFSFGSVTSWMGHNLLWLLPTIIIIINLRTMKKLKLSNSKDSSNVEANIENEVKQLNGESNIVEEKSEVLDENFDEIVKPKVKNNKTIIISICIVIAIAIISGSILLNTYLKEQSDKEQTQMKLDNSNKNEANRQNQLSNCISNAKISRTNLWNINCDDPNGKCTISNQSTINWIEQRYQNDLNNCYQLYGN